MKKTMILILVLAMCIANTSAVFAEMSSVQKDMRIVVMYLGETNAELNMKPAKMAAAPFISEGRAMVPFRFLAESIGATVSWDNGLKQARLKLGAREVVVEVGSAVGYINGKSVKLEGVPESREGSTFIPLRFVSEALGADVAYITEEQKLIVKYIDRTNWKTFTSSNKDTYSFPSDWKVEEKDYLVRMETPDKSVISYFYDVAALKAYEDWMSYYLGEGLVLAYANYNNGVDAKDGAVAFFIGSDKDEKPMTFTVNVFPTNDEMSFVVGGAYYNDTMIYNQYAASNAFAPID